MKENILRTNLIRIFIIISLFISGCTDMGMMSEDAEKAFNEASVAADSEKLTEASISFALGDTASSVTSAFSLPASGDEGSTISWTSSNTAIITVNEDGSTTVNRPSGSNAVIILTATVSKGSVISTKTFTVTVLAEAVILHTITFNANGGSGSMSSQTVAEGATVTLTANGFTRTGYTFAGWDEDSDGAADYADGASYTMGNSNVSLNAVWTALPTHTITFNANGGSGSMSSQTVAEGATVTLTANGFTRTGYTFAGWDEDSDGAADYADGASYTMGNSNVSLNAVWTALPTHTISFNANGGSGSMSSQTVAEGATVTLTANGFSRTGYTFAGWDEDSDGVADYADGASYTMGNSNVSLNAVWTALPTHTITFNANGGSGSMSSQTVAEGATVTLTANGFTRTGYTFAGWDEDSDGAADYADGASYTMGNSNVSLNAVWTALPTHTITFNANGGSGSMSSQTVAEGATVTLTANGFSRTGYTFAGWDEDSDGVADYADGASYTMGNSNVNLYAVWRENLSISSITPDGETSVSSDTDIVIKFSGSLDGTTIGTVSFASPAVTFTDGVNASISFSSSGDNPNDTITINPAGSLQQTNYTYITVSGFKDSYSSYVTCSDSDYYFPVRGAMDLYFPFTNGSLEDASGRGVTLQMHGDPTLTAGYPRDAGGNDAYSFDGVGDYLQVVGDLGISAGDDFTISAWIKLDPGFLNFNAIVSNYHNNGLKALMFRVNSSWNGHTNALDLSEGYSNNGVLSTGTWLHVVGVYINASRQVRFYVNGSAAGTGTTSYTIEDQTTQFAIGGDYLNVSPRYFKGTIDEVRFYKYALSATEVENLYNHDDID